MLGPPQARDLDRPAIVSLEALVPTNHFSRQLEATLDLGFVRAWVADNYAARGRPSIDPVVFFKLQLIMFCEGRRSERRLMETVRLNLAHRWYLGYHLDEALPDHSSLTRIRERYGLDIFRRCFDAVVEQCRAAGLVWGEELYLDATQVEANAALDSVAPRFAVAAHLAHLFPPDTVTAGDAALAPGAAADTPPPVRNSSDPTPLPVVLPDDAYATLAVENAARHDWLAEAGRQQRGVTHNDYRRKADFQVSRTDPDATVMRRKGGGAHLGYHDHYVVDGGTARIILRTLVTPAEVMEHQPARDLVWQTCFRWRLRPRQVTGDTTDGTIDTIKALEDADIRAFMPIADADKKNPLYGKGRFAYDAARDVYVCPQGQALPRDHASYTERLVRYQASAMVCN